LLGEKWHKIIYWWSSALVCIGMPLGEFFMSVGTITLLINWIIEGGFANKVQRLKQNKAALIIIGIVLLHALGLLWSEDITYGLHDLKIKLPIVVFGLVFGSTTIFSEKDIRNLFLAFVSATVISSLISVGVFLSAKFNQKPLVNIREISVFISHIRLSLMAVFSIVGLFYFLKRKELKAINVIPTVVYLSLFLLLLQSLTGGILLLIFVALFPCLWNTPSIKNIFISFAISALIIVAVVYAALPHYHYYFTPQEEDFPIHSELGTMYAHDMQSEQLENGFYVWRNIAQSELQQEWSKRSTIPLDSLDKKRQPIKATLIRYLTSKQLKKDAVGVKALTEIDIDNIENGKANNIDNSTIIYRLHEFFFEMAALRDGQNPSNNSIGQRLYAWGLSSEIIQKNMLFGVGSGDVKQAIENSYSKNDKEISKQIRAHNQFITFAIAFGLMSIFLIVGFFYLAIVKVPQLNGLKWLFYAIILFSFLFEDTLETQAGVTFFAFFAGLFCSPKNEIK
jgi:hypothetical protein